MYNENILHLLSAFAVAVLNGAAWGQCEVTQVFSQGGFGRVSISGNVAVIGDTSAFGGLGAAFVYRRNPGGLTDWNLEATLMAPKPDPDDQFGSAVAVGNDLIVIGAYTTDTHVPQGGAAYTYRYDGDVWEFETMLTASDSQPGAIFGWSVAIHGDVTLIGARDDPNEGLFQSGSAYVFRFDPDSSAWIEEAKLTDPNAEEEDLFGMSVSIRGDVALVGAHGNDDAGGGTGAAFVFRCDVEGAGDWVLEQQLQAFDAQWLAWFGRSVSLAHDVALIGAPQLDSQIGAAYVMRYDGKRWVHEAKLLATNPVGPSPLLGWAISLASDGLTALAGAFHDDEAGNDAGAVHMFRINGKTWQEIEKFAASDAAPGDDFGSSVSLSGDVALIKGGGKGYIFAGMSGLDCNENGEPDACDIFDGTSEDQDANGVPDDCDADLDGSGSVGAGDLLILLSNWGPCDNCEDCPADLNGDCIVGAADLLILLGNWG